MDNAQNNKYDEMRIIDDIAKLNLTSEQKEARITLKLDKLEAMRSGAHTKILVDFDGASLSLRLLTAQERVEATEKALDMHYKKPEIIRWKTNMELFMKVWILYYALTPCPQQVNDLYAQFNVKDLWYMTENQIDRLYQLWVEFDKEYNPNIDDMTEEEFNIWLLDVKKNPALLSHASYHLLQKTNMYYILRDKVVTLQDN